MGERYWFKARKHGHGWTPATWQGWGVILLYIVAVIHSFIQLNLFSHPFSRDVDEVLLAFLPRFFIFSALLTIITYLKGEPTTWHRGDKKKKDAS